MRNRKFPCCGLTLENVKKTAVSQAWGITRKNLIQSLSKLSEDVSHK